MLGVVEVAWDGHCHCHGCRRWSWLTSSVVGCGPCGEGVLTCGCIAGGGRWQCWGVGVLRGTEENLDIENFGVL